MNADDELRLRQAFPSGLEADVSCVAAVLPPPTYPIRPHDIGPVRLAGEPLRIPYRVRYPELAPADVERLSPRQALILGCWYTRDGDGYVRERALRGILASREAWIAPFVVQLLGEYVIEILYVLDQGLTEEHRPVYAAFLAENPDFLHLTHQRVFSYWSCNYQWHFPRNRREEYVGMRVLRRLESWSREHGHGPR